MCGIAGIISPSISSFDSLKTIAVSMADTLSHRGPDSHGVFVDPLNHLALSHRRLSIQDLSPTGHQPMTSMSGRYNIVFNGEIYNFKNLAVQLSRLGYLFRGHSDTEVLLAAMEEWGLIETLQRSRGMFAMAIFDSRKRELVLCRDRLGEKPLFFGWVGNCFTFSSELKAFKKVFSDSLEIHSDALASFFRFGYVPTPYSIYKKIFKLQPGTYLRISLAPLPQFDEFNPLCGKKSFSPKKYWNLDSIVSAGLQNQINNEDEAINLFDQLLRDSVSKQCVADVPVGSFLSGGIDSSLISAVMQAVSKVPVKTFTIGFNEKEFDEAPYARAIAEHIGSDHHEYYLSAKDGMDLINEIHQHWDEPFADASQIPSLLVAQMARRHVTVSLTGDGGDELFCGYNRYFWGQNLWKKQQSVPFFLRDVGGKCLSSIPPSTWQAAYQLYKRFTFNKKTQANVGLKIHKIAGLLRTSSQLDAYRYLMSYWQNPCEILTDNTVEVDSIFDRREFVESMDFINAAMYWDQLGYLVDDNLVKGDRSSMAYSLEARLPLLDHHIVEFSWRLPLNMKYRDGESKWILRRTLERYVPKKLFERPKMGFSVPVGEWLRGPLKEWAGDLLNSYDVFEAVSLNTQTIERVWKEHQRGKYDHSNKIWALCVWYSWLKNNRVDF